MIAVQQGRDKFSNYFFVATIIHVVVFLFMFIFNTFDFLKSDIKKIEIIKSSVRVDLVAMPKFTLQELKKMKLVPMSSKAEIKENIAVKKENILKEKVQAASKKVNLSSLFGKLSKKKVIKENSKVVKNTEKANTQKYKKELQKLVMQGNKLSVGSATTGNTDYSDSREFATYLQSLPSMVRPFWKLPSYLLEKELRCRIQVFISNSGEVLNYKIYESSGDSEFDERAIAAIKKIKTFPTPEKKIALRVASGEVILGFPL